MKRNLGFTLIEAVVTMGIVGVLMITAGTVLMNSLRSSTKVEISSLLESEATWTMGEIRQNLLQSSSELVTCNAGPNSGIGFTNLYNGESTFINCIENTKIASVSAESADLTKAGVRVSGCDNFVTCTDSGNLKVVNIGFTLSAGDLNSTDKSYSRSFNQKIVIRQ